MKNWFYRCLILLIVVSNIEISPLINAQSTEYETYGITNNLPVFYQNMAARQEYPLSWTHGDQGDFETWQQRARARVMESLMKAPPFVPFDALVIAEEDRGTYVARKIVLNITGDSRVLALILVPKSPGPHPAVLLMHDHGGKFDIGKEKVIKPFGVSSAKMNSARDWVNIYYGGRYLGDELAKRGYVCLSVDMLNWSDRGGAGADGQQALASNFLHLGASYPGLIAYEDMQAAEFLAAQPEVDSTRIAAMGLSVGGFRTWQIAALSDRIAAGVSVCWMSTYVGLMVPGNNQTKGQSAYTMLHPGLAQYLDYPDVASIACPKPMMFCNGNVDHLFPLPTIVEAHAKMRSVWDTQNAGDKLVTKLYDAPHEYNLAMQADAFKWLDSLFSNIVTKADLPFTVKSEASLSVYPNPAKQEATISYQLTESSVVKAVLVDSSGKEVEILASEIQGSGKHNFAINTSNLKNSTYLLRLDVNGEPTSVKLIVIN